MADNSIYPLQVENNVTIKRSGQPNEKTRQQVVMNDNKNGVFFNFSQKVDSKDVSLMTVRQIDGKHFVKINELERFASSNGENLSNDNVLKDIFSQNGLEIGNNAIEVSKTGDEITITITSQDGQPYVVKVTPTEISLNYGSGENLKSYVCDVTPSQNSSCLNIEMERSCVEEMLSSNGENGIFKSVNSINNLPSNIIGLYAQGMDRNEVKNLGKFTLTNCVFSENDAPYFFVTQVKPDRKAKKETLLFDNGAFLRCDDRILTQFIDTGNEKQYNLVLASEKNRKNPKYFAVPIKMDENGNVKNEFVRAYELLKDNTTLEPTGLELGDGEKLSLKNENGEIVDDIISFEKKDTRKYSNHTHTINPKNYTIEVSNQAMVYNEREEAPQKDSEENESEEQSTEQPIEQPIEQPKAKTQQEYEEPIIRGYSHEYQNNYGVIIEDYEPEEQQENNNERERNIVVSQVEHENETETPPTEMEEEIASTGDGAGFVAPAEEHETPAEEENIEEFVWPAEEESEEEHSEPDEEHEEDVPPIENVYSNNGDNGDSDSGDVGTGDDGSTGESGDTENDSTPPRNSQNVTSRPQQTNASGNSNGGNGNNGNGGNGNNGNGGSGNNGNGENGNNNTQSPAPQPKKKAHINPYLERKKEIEKKADEDKAKVKKKNDAFKERMKTLNTAMGDTLSYIGMFLMITSMIPGIGLATMIPGLIITSVGLFQTSLADKLVFEPFKKIRHELKKYEDEQDEEFEYRDQFIENEHELNKLAENSHENIDKLERLYAFNSNNSFAKDFAKLYNENGVGFPRDNEINGVYQLNQMDNLNNRVKITQSLNQIYEERNEQIRNQLIRNFANTYFQDLDREKRQKINEMFSPENEEALKGFVGALTEVNNAQLQERNLLEQQREAIRSADSYRLDYLASTEKLSDNERLYFFSRYSRDILSNNILNKDSSTEVMDRLIDRVPERQRDAVTELLHSAAQQFLVADKVVTNEAEANVARKRQLDDLKSYANAVGQIEQGSNVFASIEEITALTEDYMRSYTLSYYNGYADRLINNIASPALADNTNILPKRGIAARDENVRINNSLNYCIGHLNINSVPVKILSNSRAESLSYLRDSGIYQDIAMLYSGSQENGERILTSGSLLPNLNKKESLKEHTLFAIAEKLATEKIADVLASVTGDEQRERINGYTAQELIDNFDIQVTQNNQITIQGQPYQNADALQLLNTVQFVESQISYNNAKQTFINNFVSSDLVDIVTRKNAKEPMVVYDESKREFKVLSFDNVLKEKDGDPDYYKFKHFDEKAMIDKFTKKYPYFKKLTDEKQREFIMVKLGIDGHRERLEDERKKAIENGSFDKEAHEYKLALYDKLDNTADAVLNGKLGTAIDELAISRTLNPQNNVDRSLTALQRKGRALNSRINGLVKFNEIIASLPITEEQKRTVKENALNAHRRGSPLHYALRTEIDRLYENNFIDGYSYEQIVNRYSTLNGDRAAVNLEGINKFCENRSRLYDRRTNLNLEQAKQTLGSKFVTSQYSSRVGDIKNNVRHYSDYIEFFTENGFDEASNTSRLFNGVTTKEEHERMVSEAFATASTKRERQQLINGFVARLGCEEEYRQAKKNIAYKNPQSQENKDFTRFSREQQDFEQTVSRYYSNMSSLMAIPSLSLRTNGERINELLDKDMFKTLGLDRDEILDVIKNKDYSDNLKRNIIYRRLQKNDKQIDIARAENREKIAVAEYSRHGITSADRSARKTRSEAQLLTRDIADFNAKVDAIKDFLQKNPDYLYGQELLNAFAQGDKNFFASHPEFDKKGLNFGNLDTRLLDRLDVDMSKLTDYPDELNINGKSAKKVAKIKNKAKARNEKIVEKIVKFSKGQAVRLNKQEKAIYDKLAKQEANANPKTKGKTDFTQEKPASILTSLKTLARSFQARHEVSSQRIREELERQQRANAENENNVEDEAENA